MECPLLNIFDFSTEKKYASPTWSLEEVALYFPQLHDWRQTFPSFEICSDILDAADYCKENYPPLTGKSNSTSVASTAYTGEGMSRRHSAKKTDAEKVLSHDTDTGVSNESVASPTSDSGKGIEEVTLTTSGRDEPPSSRRRQRRQRGAKRRRKKREEKKLRSELLQHSLHFPLNCLLQPCYFV